MLNARRVEKGVVYIRSKHERPDADWASLWWGGGGCGFDRAGGSGVSGPAAGGDAERDEPERADGDAAVSAAFGEAGRTGDATGAAVQADAVGERVAAE